MDFSLVPPRGAYFVLVALIPIFPGTVSFFGGRSRRNVLFYTRKRASILILIFSSSPYRPRLFLAALFSLIADRVIDQPSGVFSFPWRMVLPGLYIFFNTDVNGSLPGTYLSFL